VPNEINHLTTNKLKHIAKNSFVFLFHHIQITSIMKTTGITLLIIGIALTLFTTFKFFTKEKVVDLGKVEITTEKPHEINWSPLLGIAVIAIGGILFVASFKKSK
jgi:hypothetical protein